jgi:hypothetical protein
MNWKPKNTAPKDGTVIIVPFLDWSGYTAIRWGFLKENPEIEGWFYLDYTDTYEMDWNLWSDCPQPLKDFV